MNHFGHDACGSPDPHHSSNTAAIGSVADGFDSQAIVGDAGILKQVGGTAVGGHEDVERAVIINVCIRGAARDVGVSESHARPDVGKTRVSAGVAPIIGYVFRDPFQASSIQSLAFNTMCCEDQT